MFLSSDVRHRFDAPPPEWKDWYRATFLGDHVDEQLLVVEDVLAVEAIRQRIEDQLVLTVGRSGYLAVEAVVREELHLSHFFGRQHIYCPLSLTAADRSSHGGFIAPDEADDLTDLLQQLRDMKSSAGVVLRTGAGAGKTVAARKAFHDCLHGSGAAINAEVPLLWGFVPCWLSLQHNNIKNIKAFEGCLTALEGIDDPAEQAKIVEIRADNIRTPNVALELLAGTASGPKSGINRENVKEWLQFGPRLLLFADLNTAPPLTAPIAAKALIEFQRKYGEFGHRCVIARRDDPFADDPFADDPVPAEKAPFQTYDLRAFKPEEAKAYLNHIGGFEEEIYDRLRQLSPFHGGSLRLQPPARHGAEMARLLERIDWHDRRHGGKHLLCTPQLLHEISQLHSGAPQDIRTVARLFDLLVRERLGGTRLPMDQITALTRPALVMHAQDRLTLGETQLQNAWETPESSGETWRPRKHAQYEWPQKPYYQGPIAPVDQQAVVNSGLLRTDRDSATAQAWSDVNSQFLHDSFIDYFVGAWSFGRPNGARTLDPVPVSLPAGWHPAAAARLRERHTRCREAAFFLGGVIAEDDVHRLLASMAVEQPEEGWPTVAAYLLHGGPRNVDSQWPLWLRRLRIACRRAAAHLWPEALFSVCFHAVPDSPFFQAAAQQLQRDWLEDGKAVPDSPFFQAAVQQLQRDWLEDSQPTSPLKFESLAHLHSRPVERVFAPLKGDRVVTLGGGAARCWDRETGEVFDLHEDGWSVTALAVLWKENQVVLGLKDGRIVQRFLVPQRLESQQRPKKVYQAEGPVVALAEWPKEQAVAASLSDGRLVHLNLRGDWRTLTKERMRPAPCHLRPLSDGSAIFADETGVIDWVVERVRLKEPYSHRRAVTYLVATEAGDVVFADSESEVFLMRRLSEGRGWDEAVSLRAPPGPVRGLGIRGGGVVVLGAAGERCSLAYGGAALGDAAPSGRLAFTINKDLIGEDTGAVRAVAKEVPAAGRKEASAVVALGGVRECAFACEGKTVAIHSAGRDLPVQAGRHLQAVTRLLTAPNWEWAVTGTAGGEVGLWDAKNGAFQRAVQAARAAVTALARPDGDSGKFVCGDATGGVAFLSAPDLKDSGARALRPIRMLPSPVTCLWPLGESEALVGCRDGAVYHVWDSDRPPIETAPAEHDAEGAVVGLLCWPDGRWLVGNAGGALRAFAPTVKRLFGTEKLDSPLETLALVSRNKADGLPRFAVGCRSGKVGFGQLTPAGIKVGVAEASRHHLGPASHLAAHPSEALAASAASDRMVLLWDADKRRLIDAYEAPAVVTALAWLSDKCLAVGGWSARIAFLQLRQYYPPPSPEVPQ